MHTLLAACGAAAPAAHKGQRGDSSSSDTSWMTGAAAGRRVSSIALESDSPPPPVPIPSSPHLQLPRGAMTATEQQTTWSLQRAAAQLRSARTAPHTNWGLRCMHVRKGRRQQGDLWRVCMHVRVCLPATCDFSHSLPGWCRVTTTGSSWKVFFDFSLFIYFMMMHHVLNVVFQPRKLSFSFKNLNRWR